MKAIERRIRNIEDELNMSEGRRKLFVVIHKVDLNHAVPEPVEEWITYKEAEANCGRFTVFSADPAKELEARKKLKDAELAGPVPEEQE